MTQLTIPQTKSSFQLRVKDKISMDSSGLDMAVKFLFKYNTDAKRNLRILENPIEMNDKTEDLKVIYTNIDLG